MLDSAKAEIDIVGRDKVESNKVIANETAAIRLKGLIQAFECDKN